MDERERRGRTLRDVAEDGGDGVYLSGGSVRRFGWILWALFLAALAYEFFLM